MWETQAAKFTSSRKVNVYFQLPDFSATKIVMWKCHIYESTTDSYSMILCRYLLTALGLYLKFPENIIIGGEGPYEECLASIVEVINYKFKYLTYKIVKPEESFINLYVNECLNSKSTIRSTHRMRRILDAKYENADLKKVTTKKCQHLSIKEQ